MSKRTKIIAAVVVLVLVAGVAGAFALKSGGSGVAIKTAKVAETNLGVTVSASGKIQAGTRAEVYPPTAGTLARVYVRDGATVTAGQKLAKMDTGPLEMAVKQAEAGLAQANAAYENLGATAVTSKDIAAARAARDAAKAAYENASDAFKAAKSFYGSSSSTTTAAAVAKKQAYAGYKSALASVAKALATDSDSQKHAAAAGVAQAEKALELAQSNLDDATLVAPIDGTVFFNPAGTPGSDGKTPLPAAGSGVAPGSAPFSVVDLSGSTFVAEVDEADIDRVKMAMAADVTLDSFAGETFKTKVTHINAAAQPTATGGTIFPVELSLKDTGKSILIGMKGDATIHVSSIPNAITIPLEALFNENGTNFVYKVVGGTKLAKTTITIGAQTDTDVEILDGLQPGDEVALASPTTYTDGMTVRVKN